MWPTLAAWAHDLDPFALRLAPGVGVRWYGLAYLAGFAAAWLLLRWLAKRRAILLTPEQATDAMFALIVGALVGGRLGYVLIYERSLLTTWLPGAPWWGLLAINRGGMASHGGLVGVIVACWWVSRRARVPLLHVMDVCALAVPPGLLLGRLANFVNGELLGRIVSPPGAHGPWWSVKFPQELLDGHAPALTPEQRGALDALLARVAPGEPNELARQLLITDIQRGASGLKHELAPLLASRHPSQLYQAMAEGIVVGAAVWWASRRPRRAGTASAVFLIVYGVGRIATEFWRLPDAHLSTAPLGARPMGLTYGQWLSAGMVAAGVGMLMAIARRKTAPRIGGWASRAPV